MKFTTFLLVCALLAQCLLAHQEYYSRLGLSRSATKQDIRKAYRKLSKKYHPDKSSGNKEKFVQISEAYEVLVDDELRRRYDKYGPDGVKDEGQGGHPFNDPFDMFESFFGGGGFGKRREKKGHNIVIQMPVSLEDLYNGKEYEVEVSKQIICPRCRGSGAKSADDLKTCDKCQGRGTRVIRQQIAPGFVQQIQTTCDACHGKGKVIGAKCPRCGMHKVVRDNEQLTIVIERGMPNDHVITLEGESDQSPDHSPGDIQVHLLPIPHAIFKRAGSNLHMDMKISLLESLVGFNKTFIHLDGREVTINREAVTPSGYIETLEDEGMPVHEIPSEKGNLFVTFEVTFPTSLDDKVKDALKELL